MVVDELVTILGVVIGKDAMAKLKSFQGAVEGVAKKIKAAGVVVTGTAAGFGAFLRTVVNGAAELDKLSQATGLSAETLQEWDYAAKAMNLDSNALRSDLEKLTKTMSSPIPGQFNQNLAMLGISVRDASGSLKTADALLLDMADKFKSMSQQRAMQWADKIGISRDTMLLLRQGKIGIEELRQEAHKLGGIIPNESIKRAAEFKKQVAELTFALRGIASQAAIATIPALSKIVSAFKDFIATNREWIQLGLESLMGGIVAGFERFWKALKKVGDFFKPLKDAVKSFLPEMSGVEWVTHLVTGALTGLAIVFAPLLAKFALIGAAIGVLSLLFEDLFVFLTGSGESVIGDLFKAFEERWPNLYKALEWLGTLIKERVIAVLQALGVIAKEVFKGIVTFIGWVVDAIDLLIGAISEVFEFWPAFFDKVGSVIKDVFSSAFGYVKSLIDSVFEVIKQVLNFITDKIDAIKGGVNKVKGWLGFGDDDSSSDTSDGNWSIDDNGSIISGRDKNIALARANELKDIAYVAAMHDTSEKVPAAQNGGQTINDNKTVNVTVVASDSARAGEAVVEALSNVVNTNTPGAYVPVAG